MSPSKYHNTGNIKLSYRLSILYLITNTAARLQLQPLRSGKQNSGSGLYFIAVEQKSITPLGSRL